MSTDDNSHDRVQELIPLLIDVEQKLDCEMSLESLARQCGYSPFHFHRFFSGEIGQTPKWYIHRLRLERAAYKLAITGETILQIALSVGFKNHETLSREFKRAFGCAPREYRRACRVAQAERLERNRSFRGDGCQLSDVRFTSLPAMTLLAIRRHGAYSTCPIPLQEDDTFWNDIARWAKSKSIPHRPLPIAISYDDPTVTPEPLQRLDACIPIETLVAGRGASAASISAEVSTAASSTPARCRRLTRPIGISPMASAARRSMTLI
jgi:AraC family transcriptional regulator